MIYHCMSHLWNFIYQQNDYKYILVARLRLLYIHWIVHVLNTNFNSQLYVTFKLSSTQNKPLKKLVLRRDFTVKVNFRASLRHHDVLSREHYD